MALWWVAWSYIAADPRSLLRGCAPKVVHARTRKNFHIISTGAHIDELVITLKGARQNWIDVDGRGGCTFSRRRITILGKVRLAARALEKKMASGTRIIASPRARYRCFVFVLRVAPTLPVGESFRAQSACDTIMALVAEARGVR
jgi:hypothetical protein